MDMRTTVTATSAPAAQSRTARDEAGTAQEWTNEELLRCVLAGHERAWREFVARHRSVMYRCIIKVTRKHAPHLSPPELDEIYADVLYALFRDDMRRLRSYDPTKGMKLSTWVGMISVQVSHDYLRVCARRPFLDRIDGVLDDREPDRRTPRQALVDKERWDHFADLLARVSERDLQFLQMYFGQGLDPAAIAEALAINIKTVYTRKHKIRAHLRRYIAEEGEVSVLSDLLSESAADAATGLAA